MKKNRLFAILIAFFTFSCFAQNWKAKHVVLIGLDGWGAYSVEKAEMPNVKTLMDAGCYTLKKRSVLPFFKCSKLGFHVYGCRSRIARIYTMGVQNT